MCREIRDFAERTSARRPGGEQDVHLRFGHPYSSPTVLRP